MNHHLPPVDPELDRFADLPNGLQLCFRTYGHPDHPPIVLIAGLGLQLVSWPQALIDGLVAEGLYVITLDNRDMGRSSYLPQTPPARWRLLLDRIPSGHYLISDMANDVIALLDHLGAEQAHVLGMSMGGMIAQNVAAQAPQRVLSLTSIFSTTGNKQVGQPAASTIWRMLTNRPAWTLPQAQDKFVQLMRHIGNPEVPGVETLWRQHMALAWQRTTPELSLQGYERQVTAIVASGDRTGLLHRIQAPTLVLHGDRDYIVHPSGGEATARAISGAQLHTLVGMRHQLDAAITPALLELIVPHVRDAQR